ncbi:prepilin-type N-terminal cleavage/methylation domain-containing protein [Lichenihabitans sp. Uapishka_5]|uniref:PulJ/GspJ family protein n=1 Tax=Lichenihabitans sp. Uapishka_5 TaxID=3037302 RepID=UPI0029E7EB82|nr:prepilin-type N-terminal cleavage/methylation domain-containing protein [Lichenihabitans sp. Uapishka_5]MDX7951711.1 prepilin-type N-terminal cleavage/methylation domain-containing protein [Lichenihabitans sp. Uapishka_5]
MRRAAEPTAGTIEDPRAGLTLIEMIISLAIGALVIAFVAEGTGMIRSFGRLGAAVSAQDETLAVRDHLRATVAAALGGGTGPQAMGFAGVEDTAVFSVPGDRLLESGASVRITLAALPDHGRMALVETRAPIGQEGSGDPQTRTRRLVGGAAAVGFRYYGALSGDAAPGWARDWTDPEATPRLMRIDVTFPPGDPRRWPPFVVLMPTARSPAAAALATVGKTAAAAVPSTP